MKIIVTIIPTNLVTDYSVLSFCRKQKQELKFLQVGDLLQRYTEFDRFS